MVIISKKAIAEFIVNEPQSAEALMNWYRETKISDWKNFADVKNHSIR
jgi:mRNA-degrading endonuclease HigB of HigAB toxin-antitoxin module